MATSISTNSRAASAKQERLAEPSARSTRGKAGDKRRTDTRARLAAATVEIIDASGWPSVTLAAVAKACSISTPAMYKHFPDKAALFEAAQEEMSGRLGALADAAAAAHESPVDSIFDVGERLIAYSEEHPNLLEFAFFGPSSNNTSAVDAGAGARWELLAFVHREIGRFVESQALPPWRNADEAGRDLFVSLWSFIQGYSKLVTSGTVRHRSAFLKAALIRAVNYDGADLGRRAPRPSGNGASSPCRSGASSPRGRGRLRRQEMSKYRKQPNANPATKPTRQPNANPATESDADRPARKTTWSNALQADLHGGIGRKNNASHPRRLRPPVR